jgi:hypothetical protein
MIDSSPGGEVDLNSGETLSLYKSAENSIQPAESSFLAPQQSKKVIITVSGITFLRYS